MPNIVHYDRLNEDKHKTIKNSTLGESDFKEVYNKLIDEGYLDRDNLIDLEYLTKRTRKKLVFPKIINNGTELHPITFILFRNGSKKLVLTKDFIADPLRAISFL